LERGLPAISKFLWLLRVIFDRRIVISKRDVIAERVEPNVVHEIFVERQLDPPIEPRFGPRNAQIAGKSFDRVAQFGLPKIGNDYWPVGLRALVDQIEQPLFVLLEPEIIIFLFAKLDLAPFRSELAIGSAFLVGQKLFLTNRVITGLLRLINPAALTRRGIFLVPKTLQHSLHHLFVARRDRFRPAVIFHVQLFPEIDKLLGNTLDEFRRRNAGFGSGLLHFLAVLVDAGQEENFLALAVFVSLKSMIT